MGSAPRGQAIGYCLYGRSTGPEHLEGGVPHATGAPITPAKFRGGVGADMTAALHNVKGSPVFPGPGPRACPRAVDRRSQWRSDGGRMAVHWQCGPAVEEATIGG